MGWFAGRKSNLDKRTYRHCDKRYDNASDSSQDEKELYPDAGASGVCCGYAAEAADGLRLRGAGPAAARSEVEVKRQDLDASITAYYDSISDEELADEREWAEMAGPNVLLDIEPNGIEL